jgi:DNA invertase Pin-like site-specific DNA recombinase
MSPFQEVGQVKAALYLRVSTTMQIDKDSLPMQRTDLINYCKYALNIEDYEIFEDAGYSGKDTDRPAYQRMMDRIRQGEFSHLLVWKIDRISRNLLDFAGMYQELKKFNIIFVSKNEQFDTSTAMGEAMLNITLVFAELERKLTAERVLSTMVSRASKGLFNGGVVPMGYKISNKGSFPSIEPSEAHTIQLIYDLYEKHQSTNTVMHELTRLGVKTRQGNDFSDRTLIKIIRNPFYKGTFRYNYRDGDNTYRKNEDEWILVEDNHEAIISVDQWERCNQIMNHNSRDTSRFRRGEIHLFSGLLRCSSCGRIMSAHLGPKRKDGTSPTKYRCHSRSLGVECHASPYVFVERRIAPVIFQSIADIAQGKKVITRQADDVLTYTIDGKNATVTHGFIDGEREKYRKALARLNDLYLFSGMSEKDYLLKKASIEKKLQELKDMQIDKPKRIDDDFLKLASYYMINKEFMTKKKINYKKIVDNVDKKVMREFLNTIIHEIKISDGQVESITYANGSVLMLR